MYHKFLGRYVIEIKM